jgi:hypothetical protein
VHESGLRSLGAYLGGQAEAKEESPSLASQQTAAEQDPLVPLVPLGARRAEGDGSGDLSSETMRYIGDGSNLFRPSERPVTAGGSQYVIDATGRKKRVGGAEQVVADNVRLRRSIPRGAVVGVVMALVQFLVTHKVPESIAMLQLPGLSGGESLGNAIMYAFYLSIFLGFMLSAVLVQFKWGAVPGFFIGLILGAFALRGEDDSPLWGIVAGCLAGVLVGRVAAKGAKRVINV